MTSTEIQQDQRNPLEIYRASAVPVDRPIVRAAMEYVEGLAAAITDGVCPDWCQLPAGHGYYVEGIAAAQVSELSRVHYVEISPQVRVECFEQRSLTGVVSVHLATVLIDVEGVEDLTPLEAMELSQAIGRAASRCMEIREVQVRGEA